MYIVFFCLLKIRIQYCVGVVYIYLIPIGTELVRNKRKYCEIGTYISVKLTAIVYENK